MRALIVSPHRRFIKDFVDNEVASVRGILPSALRDMPVAVARIAASKGKIVVTGIGKSGHIGQKAVATMTSLGLQARFLHAAEAFHGDLGQVGHDDAVLAISHSGETKEVLRVVRHLREHGNLLVAVTGNRSSTLGKAADVALTYAVRKEGSPYDLAPMASATATLVLVDLLAAELARKRGFTKKDFADFHPGGALGLQLTPVSEVMVGKDRVPTVTARTPFSKAIAVISKKRLGVTGIVDAQGRLIGVFTDGDIRRFLLEPGFSMDIPIGDVMIPLRKSLLGSDSLHHALKLMEKKKVTSLFVVDGKNRPIGVVHMHHIVEGKIL